VAQRRKREITKIQLKTLDLNKIISNQHQTNKTMADTASIPQQRALAYAPKPFAALSILSSTYVFYYLLWKRRDKLQRMYHRLILAAFANVLLCAICFFVGSWALPADTNMVGAAGTIITCSVQGAVITVGWLALAAYYAAFGIYGLVAVKENFHQENIQWLEKWIHLWAYGPTLAMFIAAGIIIYTKEDTNPFCTVAEIGAHYMEPPAKYTIWLSLVLVDFIVGTGTILYLWFNFSQIQKRVDETTGMRRLIESARRRRLQDVNKQTLIYLFLFSYGYFVPIISMWINIATEGYWMYYLDIVGLCMSASQGVVFVVIYFVLQKPELELKDLTGYFASKSTRHYQNNTVDEIRQNAKAPRKRKTLLPRFSFCIFDGEPAEDSPWAQFFEDDSAADDDTYIKSIQEHDFDGGLMTALL
jgi:hypothetical protein